MYAPKKCLFLSKIFLPTLLTEMRLNACHVVLIELRILFVGLRAFIKAENRYLTGLIKRGGNVLKYQWLEVGSIT